MADLPTGQTTTGFPVVSSGNPKNQSSGESFASGIKPSSVDNDADSDSLNDGFPVVAESGNTRVRGNATLPEDAPAGYVPSDNRSQSVRTTSANRLRRI